MALAMLLGLAATPACHAQGFQNAAAEEPDEPAEPEPPLPAAQLETRMAVRNAQYAERLVAAAKSVGDVAELKIQSLKLSAIYAKVPDHEDAHHRMTCGSAIWSLVLLAGDYAEPRDPHKIVAATSDRKQYLQQMNACERNLRIAPPEAPNLR